MNCVRCGDTKQWHCKADGSNVRNALCPAFLERWPDAPAEASAPAAKPGGGPSSEVVGADPSAMVNTVGFLHVEDK